MQTPIGWLLVALKSLTVALFLSASVGFAADGKVQREVEGRYSVVRLLGVVRADGRDLSVRGGSAKDGLTFLFLVARRPLVDGLFALTELRDFQVAGESYRETSTATLGTPVEPTTTIDDVPDFIRQFPKFAAQVPKEHQTAVAMVASIGGSALVSNAPGQVSIDVGWGGMQEKFVFSFRVPPKKP